LDTQKGYALDRIEQAIREEKDNNFYFYRKFLRSQTERQAKEGYLVQAYANTAELEAYRRLLMGKELNKLQQRIGRQRAANRKLQEKLKEKDLAIDNAHEYARAQVAELERRIAGQEKNKLQQRIGRQRAANRELQLKLQRAQATLQQVTEGYEKDLHELREQLAAERNARRIWSAGYTEGTTST
jgi:hypothetical protein